MIDSNGIKNDQHRNLPPVMPVPVKEFVLIAAVL